MLVLFPLETVRLQGNPEAVIVDIIKECPTKVEYIIVNEAGASVYSASKLATEEFPNFDVGQRNVPHQWQEDYRTHWLNL